MLFHFQVHMSHTSPQAESVVMRYFAHTTLDVIVTRQWCDRLYQLREVRLASFFVLTVPRGNPRRLDTSNLVFVKGESQATSYSIGQFTTVIRIVVLTSQVQKELVSATDVYVLTLCSLQQQVIHHNYGILKLLTYCVHREGDNSLKCDYNHRGSGLGCVVRLPTSWMVRGSNPGGGRDFLHLSRPALRPTQPPVQ